MDAAATDLLASARENCVNTRNMETKQQLESKASARQKKAKIHLKNANKSHVVDCQVGVHLKPKIAMLSPSSSSWGEYKVGRYAGNGSIPISIWFRKFEDYVETMSIGRKEKMDDKEKVSLLKFHLEGIPRDTFEQIPNEDRVDYDKVKKFLIKSLESPKSLDLARQILRNVIHDPTESVDQFAARLAPLVRAAYSGEGETAIMKRTLEEFTDKIKEPIGLLMSGQVYSSFEEARMIAKSVEAALIRRGPSQSLTGSYP